MKSIFDHLSIVVSRKVTRMYSTSFSMGVRMLGRKYRDPIYSVYGFVRFADEIVDTFHEYNKKDLLDEFIKDTYRAVDEKISLNPVLNSFQHVVNEYHIERELIGAFFKSMQMDLQRKDYSRQEFNDYVLGSAEVVGLMCLRIFCNGKEVKYKELKPAAMKLGAAFQKINFLRDLKQDYLGMGRSYFPDIALESFSEEGKKAIEKEIKQDFQAGYQGIKGLPQKALPGVYLSYAYYHALFRKIRRIHASRLLEKRVRISNFRKYCILVGALIRIQLGII